MEDPRQKLDEMAPAVEAVRASLPPLPPMVYLVVTPVLEESDKVLWEGDGINLYQPVYASKSDAEARLAEIEKQIMTYERDVVNSDIDEDDLNADGTYTFRGQVLEVIVE